MKFTINTHIFCFLLQTVSTLITVPEAIISYSKLSDTSKHIITASLTGAVGAGIGGAVIGSIQRKLAQRKVDASFSVGLNLKIRELRERLIRFQAIREQVV